MKLHIFKLLGYLSYISIYIISYKLISNFILPLLFLIIFGLLSVLINGLISPIHIFITNFLFISYGKGFDTKIKTVYHEKYGNFTVAYKYKENNKIEITIFKPGVFITKEINSFITNITDLDYVLKLIRNHIDEKFINNNTHFDNWDGHFSNTTRRNEKFKKIGV